MCFPGPSVPIGEDSEILSSEAWVKQWGNLLLKQVFLGCFRVITRVEADRLEERNRGINEGQGKQKREREIVKPVSEQFVSILWIEDLQ